MGVRDPELGRGDVAEDGPDERHGALPSRPARERGSRRRGGAGRRPPRPGPPGRRRRGRPPSPRPCRPPGPWPCTGPSSGSRHGRRGSPRSTARRPARCAVADDERAQRDPDRGPVGQVAPCRAVAAGRGGPRSGRRRGRSGRRTAGRQDVLGGHPVVAVDAARLAHADPRPERDERGALVAGHTVHKEPGVLERLAPPGDLELGQDIGVGGVADRPSGSRRTWSRRVMIVASPPRPG